MVYPPSQLYGRCVRARRNMKQYAAELAKLVLPSRFLHYSFLVRGILKNNGGKIFPLSEGEYDSVFGQDYHGIILVHLCRSRQDWGSIAHITLKLDRMSKLVSPISYNSVTCYGPGMIRGGLLIEVL